MGTKNDRSRTRKDCHKATPKSHFLSKAFCQYHASCCGLLFIGIILIEREYNLSYTNHIFQLFFFSQGKSVMLPCSSSSFSPETTEVSFILTLEISDLCPHWNLWQFPKISIWNPGSSFQLFFPGMFWHCFNLYYADGETLKLVLATRQSQDQLESLLILIETCALWLTPVLVLHPSFEAVK